jgi:O-antigen/teichoic acid export membrane protein
VALLTGQTARGIRAVLGGPRKRAAAATFAATLCNTALVVGQGIVLVPLYVSHVGPALYGAWLASGDVLVWLQAFDLGLPNLLIQRIGAASGREDRGAASEYFWAGASMLVAFAAVMALFGLSLSAWAAGSLTGNSRDAHHLGLALTLGVCASALNIANNAVVALTRADQDTTLQGAGTLIGSVVGFVTTLTLLQMGFGLISISAGMLARMVVLIGVSTMIVAQYLRRGRLVWRRPRKTNLLELLTLTPATALGGLAYSVTTQSDAILIATVLGPVAVPVFVLTRKAADMMRILLDTFSNATYAGFAHLYSSPQRAQAAAIAATMTDTRLVCATVMASGYVVVNEAWLRLWVGGQYNGGLVLTFAVALQLIVTGQSYLYNSYLRATGRITNSSQLLIGEAVVKLGLALLFLYLAGLVGLVLGTLAASILFMLITRRRLNAALEYRLPSIPLTTVFSTAVLLIAGLALAWLVRGGSFAHAATMASAMCMTGAIILRFDLVAKRLAGRRAPGDEAIGVASI